MRENEARNKHEDGFMWFVIGLCYLLFVQKNNLGIDCGYIQIKRKVLINWVAPFCVKSEPLELIQSRIDYMFNYISHL